MSAGRPFEPLERATISERVRDDLHGRIAAGELAPGSPLPAERVLAERFGVARTSVREAIQGLVALGVVERRGNRSFVVEQVAGSELPASDGGKRSLRALLEAWRILELTTSELAVVRATVRERTEVLQLARQSLPASADAFARADREFHSSIAAACGNPVLAEIHGRVIETLAATEGVEALVLGVGPGRTTRAAIAAAGVEHLAIAEAFVAADTAAMLAAADRHLGHVRDRISAMSRRLLPAADGESPRAARRAIGL
jgi:GntR family transcriptional regulator, transcriptional repressor for pyruvate dehydrogenase complex